MGGVQKGGGGRGGDAGREAADGCPSAALLLPYSLSFYGFRIFFTTLYPKSYHNLCVWLKVIMRNVTFALLDVLVFVKLRFVFALHQTIWDSTQFLLDPDSVFW